jgi:dihydroxyacid dehydratase/phosphogluconate dehydratase
MHSNAACTSSHSRHAPAGRHATTQTYCLPFDLRHLSIQIGIGSVWYEGNPCNMHLNDLAASVKRGVKDAGLVGFCFNTVGVSDGISMGTDGMSYSLQSRDLIADSIETIMGAQVRCASAFDSTC